MSKHETNMEHYRSKIFEIATRHSTAFGLKNGELIPCDRAFCRNCDWDSSTEKCGLLRTIWLMEDYKPEIKLTAHEKGFVECMKDGWLARDKNGYLGWYETKPDRTEWSWHIEFCELEYAQVTREKFTFITWEDEEPWSVEDLRKLEVRDE